MKERSNLPYYLGLFLISPVLSLISSMASFRDRNAKLMVVLFLGVFGFTLILTPGKDSYSHAEQFTTVYQYMSLNEFASEIESEIRLQGSVNHADEPYLSILSYTIAQFTDNPAWLFLIAGLIYGFFFIRGISLVYNDMHRKWTVALLILFVLFISWKNIEGLNSIRNWTGAWVFFNGAFLYLKTTDKRYILLVMLAPFFHFGYLLLTVPFYIYIIFNKDFRYLYLTIAVLTMLFSTSLEFVEPYITSTELGEDKFGAYTGERFLGEHAGERGPTSFHARYYGFAGSWVIKILFIYSIIFLGYLKKENHDRFLTSLGSFGLIMFSFANVAEVVPVLGNRAFINFGLYALAYIVILFSRLPIGYKGREYIVYLSTPAIFLFLFTQYSMIGDFMDFRVLISPLLYPFIGDEPVSMKEFIRMILDV